jgi:hypothetical protein
MSIDLDKIYVKHWVKIDAKLAKEFIKTKKIAYSDLLMHYFPIVDSIHYYTIETNDTAIYKEYICTTEQKEHSIEKFKELIENFDIEKIGSIKLTIEFNLVCVTDGVHRLAVLKNCYKLGKIPLKYLDIKYPQSTLNKIYNVLKATTQTVHYNGWSNGRTQFGYHSFEIYNFKVTGQRNPKERLDIMRKSYNFENKSVVDLGCNTGGMLFHLFEIKKGLGVDFDIKCVNAAQTIKTELKIYEHLDFVQKDLNESDIDILLGRANPDIVFLLSLGSWVKNWANLYTTVLKFTPTIILETNNSQEGHAQLELFRKLDATITLISSSSKDDITKNIGRQTYLIQRANPV